MNKLQTELQKSTTTLSQDISALGTRTDLLENKHDELAIAFNDLSRKHESLFNAFTQLQAHMEDLDNRNRWNNLRIRGVPESITDVPAYSTRFQFLFPEQNPQSFICDRIHFALKAKPPPDKRPRDLVLCMKDFLVIEEIMRAGHINLDIVQLQIYPDISQATLDRRRKIKEITTAVSSVRIRYRWGFTFKLIISYNKTTYIATSIPEGQDILIKLGLINPQKVPCTPFHSPSCPDLEHSRTTWRKTQIQASSWTMET